MTVTVPGFEVVEVLGQGGMGVVYRARQLSLGREVALKLMAKGIEWSPAALGRFQREARTASAFNHPNVCAIFDLGEHAGQPYIAMELVPGKTLRTLGAQPLERVLPILKQVASALAAAHAADIVHRDVKPENVMVRDDGVVKVVDFGLARLSSRSGETYTRATKTGAAPIGTIAYMSPEQARAEPVEHPSDVFSFGLLAYELCAGRHPFAADSAVATLAAIQFEQARPPSIHNSVVNQRLDALVLAMLAKDPRARPTMQTIVAELAEVGERGPRPRASARPVVGRAAELAALEHAFAAAVAGHGSVVAIAGEPGMGKTTLVGRFLADVEAQAFAVARGACSERLADAEAYLPVLEALEGLSRTRHGEVVARLMKRVASSWHAQVFPGEAPPPGAPISQERRKRELVALVEELARLGPLVLFIDDVHWADVSTTDLVAHLAPVLANVAALLIVAYRPSDLALAKHPFASIKLDLLARGLAKEIAPARLGPTDVAQYLALAFPGQSHADSLPTMVAEQSGGSPFFVVELVRYLRERGFEPTVRDLPASMKSLIQRQLDRLAEPDARLLAAASVQGPTFDAAVVAEALGEDPIAVEDRLVHLEQAHALVRLEREQDLPDGTPSSRYQFVHALFHEAFQGSLRPTRRASLAAAIGRVLVAHQREPASIASELANLFETARDFPAAARHCLVAASQAQRVSALREAVALARRGLTLVERMPDSRERLELELGLLTVLDVSTRALTSFASPELEPIQLRALAVGERLGGTRHAAALFGIGLHQVMRGEVRRGIATADALHALVSDSDIAVLRLGGDILRGVTRLHDADPTTSLAVLEPAVASIDHQLDLDFLRLFGNQASTVGPTFIAWGKVLQGRVADARALTDRTMAPFTGSTSVAEMHSLVFIAYTGAIARDIPRVLDSATRGAALGLDVDLPFYEALCIGWKGWAMGLSGELEAGTRVLVDGIRRLRLTGTRTVEVQMLGMLAELQVLAGRRDEARATWNEARRVMAQTGDRYYAPELERQWADLIDDPSEREAAYRRAIALARDCREHLYEARAALLLARIEPRPADALTILADAVARLGPDSGAREAEEARELLT